MTRETASLEEAIEVAYWVFDAQRKGYKPHPIAKSERDAFKDTLRAFIVERGAGETNVSPLRCAAIVAVPHERRITLRFETDFQYAAAERYVCFTERGAPETPAVSSADHYQRTGSPMCWCGHRKASHDHAGCCGICSCVGFSEKASAPPMGFGVPVLMEQVWRLMADGDSCEEAFAKVCDGNDLRTEARTNLRENLAWATSQVKASPSSTEQPERASTAAGDSGLNAGSSPASGSTDKCEHGIPRRFCTALHTDVKARPGDKCERCMGTGSHYDDPGGRCQACNGTGWDESLPTPRTARRLVDCPRCHGSGFDGNGSGYDAVCGECGGQKQVPIWVEDNGASENGRAE